MTKQELIEDYQRKIEFINDMIESASGEKLLRLIIKRGCYRSFITDLERLGDSPTQTFAIENINDKDNVKFLLDYIKQQKYTTITHLSNTTACDVCGMHPVTIIQTSAGRFCQNCVKY